MDVATKFGEGLAAQIVKAANKGKEQLEYDKTFFCTILKTSTEISDNVTEAEAETLDDLNSGWYYVKIYGTFYKLRCDDVTFEIDEDVKVCVPQNNWNRMYIVVAKGGGGSEEHIIVLSNNNWEEVVISAAYKYYTQEIEIDWEQNDSTVICDVKLSQDLNTASDLAYVRRQRVQWGLVTDFSISEGKITFRCLNVIPTVDLTVSAMVML